MILLLVHHVTSSRTTTIIKAYFAVPALYLRDNWVPFPTLFVKPSLYSHGIWIV